MEKKKVLIAFIVVAILLFGYLIVRYFTTAPSGPSLQSERQSLSTEEYASEVERLRDQLERARERESLKVEEDLIGPPSSEI